MNHLGFELEKIKIGSFDFTCCEGCQLQLANRESNLPDFLALLDIRNFREISSERLDDYDIALVEGSITRSDEVERLKSLGKERVPAQRVEVPHNPVAVNVVPT